MKYLLLCRLPLVFRHGSDSGGSGASLEALEQRLSLDGSSGVLEKNQVGFRPKRLTGKATTSLQNGLVGKMYERVNGLGWSDIPESPSFSQWLFGNPTATKMCLERTGGQQRCFPESESQIAVDNDCQNMNSPCSGGKTWCCSGGFPESTSSTNPGYVPTPTRIPGMWILLGLGIGMAGAWYMISRVRPVRRVI